MRNCLTTLRLNWRRESRNERSLRCLIFWRTDSPMRRCYKCIVWIRIQLCQGIRPLRSSWLKSRFLKWICLCISIWNSRLRSTGTVWTAFVKLRKALVKSVVTWKNGKMKWLGSKQSKIMLLRTGLATSISMCKRKEWRKNPNNTLISRWLTLTLKCKSRSRTCKSN